MFLWFIWRFAVAIVVAGVPHSIAGVQQWRLGGASFSRRKVKRNSCLGMDQNRFCGLEHVVFFQILGIIIQRVWNHKPENFWGLMTNVGIKIICNNKPPILGMVGSPTIYLRWWLGDGLLLLYPHYRELHIRDLYCWYVNYASIVTNYCYICWYVWVNFITTSLRPHHRWWWM